MIISVSGRYLRKRLLDFVHITYTHPWGGVDVPFGGCDLWPNFLPLILRPLLTLFDVMADDKFIFRTIYSSESVCWIVCILPQTFLRECRCAFWGVWPFNYFLTFDFEAIIDFNQWRGILLASALLLIHLITAIGNKMCLSTSTFALYRYQIVQIWVIFSHLKLWVAVARRNCKWVKIYIR